MATRHHCCNVPVSLAATSDALRDQVPARVWPSKALSGLLGVGLPKSAGEVAEHWFSTGPLTPSSSSCTPMLLAEQPKVLAGTPGRSMTRALAAPWLRLKMVSPTQVWVAVMMRFRSTNVPTGVTTRVEVTPAALLSGMARLGVAQ